MIETFDFHGHELSRVFKGNWQLAGGHGNITREEAMETLQGYTDHGVNVFDVGDIYNGSEDLVGEFMREYHVAHPERDLRVHTKFVPDLDALADLSERDVRTIIERSLSRLGLNSLHLVQFHWWDFSIGDYATAGKHLQQLKNEGLIEQIGVTNCDQEHLEILLNAGVEIASNQIQFSLLDPRPLNGMLDFAQENDIKIFCYGVLSGGLLAGAKPGEEPTNRSHIKYALMIKEAGAEYYETLLQKLDALATKYQTSTANIATRFILTTEGVSSVILGPRNANHLSELDSLSNLRLEQQDYDVLHKMLLSLKSKVHDDVYSYERQRTGEHGRIMKYNLNGMREPRS